MEEWLKNIIEESKSELDSQIQEMQKESNSPPVFAKATPWQADPSLFFKRGKLEKSRRKKIFYRLFPDFVRSENLHLLSRARNSDNKTVTKIRRCQSDK